MITIAGTCGPRCESLTDRVIIDMARIMGTEAECLTYSEPCFRLSVPQHELATSRHHRFLFHQASDDLLYGCVIGEWYYQQELTNPARHLLNLIKQQSKKSSPHILDPALLNQLDGIYLAIVFDQKNRKTHFISDRLGLRPLYFLNQKGRLFWASEPKAFLACPGFSPELDPDALKQYLAHDFLRGNHTLLSGVKLMPAATLRTYDIADATCKDHIWWKWSHSPDNDIPPPDKEDEYAEELARLFRQSVTERSRLLETPAGEPFATPGHKKPSGKKTRPLWNIGLGLSGGLDSRAILSALPNPERCYLFTFGRKESPERLVAEQVSQKVGLPLHFMEINEKNWLLPRFRGVWWTDGQANIMHMHGLEHAAEIGSQIDIQLNGGIQNFVRGALSGPDASWEWDRLRRFQRMGTLLDDRYMITRFPFYDYQILDFLSGLHPEWVQNDRLYLTMLQNHFGSLFHGVTYSNIGYPIDARFQKVRFFLFRIKRRLGFVNPAFHNYPSWIQHQLPLFRTFLDSPQTRLSDHGYRSEILSLLKRYKAGTRRRHYPEKNPGGHAAFHVKELKTGETLCRFLTIELYLRFLEDPPPEYS